MTDLSPGFPDSVGDAQRCFRAVLDAMSRPGRLHRVGALEAPSPLGSAAAAVLLTLADHETPLWIDDDLNDAIPWIAFHCGATITDGSSRATFVLASRLPDLDVLQRGTYEQPETSATVVLKLRALGSGPRWRLSGPGLRNTTTLQAEGLPADFADRWRVNRAGFPCGVDLILCAGDTLTALPRTVAIEDA